MGALRSGFPVWDAQVWDLPWVRCPQAGMPLGWELLFQAAPALGCSCIGIPPVREPSVSDDPASRYLNASSLGMPRFGSPQVGVSHLGLFPVQDDPALGCPGLGSPGSGPLRLRYLQFGSPWFGMPGGSAAGGCGSEAGLWHGRAAQRAHRLPSPLQRGAGGTPGGQGGLPHTPAQ